jgi:cell division septal protein FtsQ
MSLFSSGQSNKRIKRSGSKRSQNLLQVSVKPERESRVAVVAPLRLIFKLVVGVGLLGGGMLGGRTALKRLIWENPAYAISDIRFNTDGMLTRAQVLEMLELWEGKNIFTVDVAKMRTVLDQLPQVDRAEVKRMLPDRVDIRVTERQPVAWVSGSENPELTTGGNAFLVDSRGYVLRTRKVLPEHLTLPLIVGVHMEDVAPGQKLPTPESLAAIELLRQGGEDLRWQPRLVDVSKGYCMVVTDQRRTRVTFGFDNLEDQIARLRQLMDSVEPMQRELQTVNLMLERNIPVTFVPLPPPAVVADGKAKGKGSGGKGQQGLPTPVSTAVTAEQIAKAQAQAAQAQAQAALLAQQNAPVSSPLPQASGGSLPAVPNTISKLGSGGLSGGVTGETPQGVGGTSGARGAAGGTASITQVMAKKEPASAPVSGPVDVADEKPRRDSRGEGGESAKSAASKNAARQESATVRTDPSSDKKPTEGKDAASGKNPRKSGGPETADRSAPKGERERAEKGEERATSKKVERGASGQPQRAVPVEREKERQSVPSPVVVPPPPTSSGKSLNPTEALRKLFQPHG